MQIAQINGLTSNQLTSIELRDQSIRIADCLRALGVTDNDQVAFLAENRHELATIIFGTLLLGATAVPMNSTYSARNDWWLLELSATSEIDRHILFVLLQVKSTMCCNSRSPKLCLRRKVCWRPL